MVQNTINKCAKKHSGKHRSRLRPFFNYNKYDFLHFITALSLLFDLLPCNIAIEDCSAYVAPILVAVSRFTGIDCPVRRHYSVKFDIFISFASRTFYFIF